MAKLLKNVAFEKINWTSTIKNFKRLSKDNKFVALNTIGKELAAGKYEAIGKVNPEYVPKGPHIIVLGGGIIIIVVGGPIPKPFPGIGPYVRDTYQATINAKDFKFDRFASNGIQHLMLTSSKSKIEILSMPK